MATNGHEETRKSLITDFADYTDLAGLVYSAKSSFKASFGADFNHRPQLIYITFCKASIIFKKARTRFFWIGHEKAQKAQVDADLTDKNHNNSVFVSKVEGAKNLQNI